MLYEGRILTRPGALRRGGNQNTQTKKGRPKETGLSKTREGDWKGKISFEKLPLGWSANGLTPRGAPAGKEFLALRKVRFFAELQLIPSG